MIFRIEIKNKETVFEAQGEGIRKSVLDLGLSGVAAVRVIQVYTLEGSLNEREADRISREFLVDPLTQDYSLYFSSQSPSPRQNKNDHIIEIAYNTGVMDPVEQSTLKGIADLGISGVASVRTSKKYIITGTLTAREEETIVNKVLANKLIQHVVKEEDIFKSSLKQRVPAAFNLIHVDLIGANDKALKKLSQDGQLFLNLDEMKAIQKYFRQHKRNPTNCELETIAQTWSEHCNHKTFRGNIRYTYHDKGQAKTKTIRSLLKKTIMKATEDINKSWCVSVFHDNAGVIEFDKESNVCFKVETHNHPSALEPFGGANTGVGGVIRDILGTGLGAKPVCSTDVFCFAPPDMSFKDLPPGTLHPKRIMKGVVSGVRDYGNKMGIPTVNGAILFDKRFVGNPLVYCGNVGLLPKNKVFKKERKGDLVVVMGGRTGRDGIHGATFSSGELTTESETISSGAVQIGDPIQEKKVMDALLQARDKDLYHALTDCGAGGLSSAVGEMGQVLGARVDLEKVPLKYEGLVYDEIWISESQERMVLAVSPPKVEALMKICAAENVEATVIGVFTGTKRLELFYADKKVCDLDMDFLHDGVPKITKEAHWNPPTVKAKKIEAPRDLTPALCDVLGHYNVCSKEWVVRQYDHEVQGGSVVKPFVGVNTDGPSDASVIAPKPGSFKGLAVSNGINVLYGKIDPFWMAASCIDEAVRQIISVGGTVDRIAILDNFCWGNPDKPDRLGGVVRAAEGCYKAAVAYQVPFISGKDSFYNEYAEGKKTVAIPGTLLISALGIVDDVRKVVTMDFKEPGNLIYVVGETLEELGGSIYWDTRDYLGSSVPQVKFSKAKKKFAALAQAVHKGLIRSMHDCSEGGLGVALAEMAFSGDKGITVRLDKVPFKGSSIRSDHVLFSETNSRFVVEVAPENKKKFENMMQGITYGLIGRVESTPEFILYGLDEKVCVNAFIETLKQSWKKPLAW